MTALSRLARLAFQKDVSPRRQFCGISNAALGGVYLTGDRKASRFSGYEDARMEQLHVIAAANVR